jgi:hypothetical protein
MQIREGLELHIHTPPLDAGRAAADAPYHPRRRLTRHRPNPGSAPGRTLSSSSATNALKRSQEGRSLEDYQAAKRDFFYGNFRLETEPTD